MAFAICIALITAGARTINFMEADGQPVVCRLVRWKRSYRSRFSTSLKWSRFVKHNKMLPCTIYPRKHDVIRHSVSNQRQGIGHSQISRSRDFQSIDYWAGQRTSPCSHGMGNVFRTASTVKCQNGTVKNNEKKKNHKGDVKEFLKYILTCDDLL